MVFIVALVLFQKLQLTRKVNLIGLYGTDFHMQIGLLLSLTILS